MPIRPARESQPSRFQQGNILLNDCGTFLFGERALRVSSDDMAFLDRLRLIYAECEVERTSNIPVALVCDINVSSSTVTATFQDSVPLRQVDFNLSLFPDKRYFRVASLSDGREVIVRAVSPEKPFAWFKGNDIVIVDRTQPWEAFLGHYMVHRLLRLQPHILFFHASSASVGGQGLLFGGFENSGKTTISLSLAARGHGFLGDDIAAVRQADYLLLPVRRSASIRPGPSTSGLHEQLQAAGFPQERYSDGEIRTRAAVGKLFPLAARDAVPLRHAFFLRGFSDAARVESVPVSMDLVRWLTPLGSTLWGISPGKRLMDFFRMLSQVRCHFLTHGRTPEETIAAVEQIVGDSRN
jgi:hypothetical protein